MKYTFTIELNGIDPVMDGMGIKMTGKGSDSQAFQEITVLPYWLGVNMAVLKKKLFDNDESGGLHRVSDSIKYGEDLNIDLFRKGFKKGMSDVDAVDRATVPTIVAGFSVKEDK